MALALITDVNHSNSNLNLLSVEQIQNARAEINLFFWTATYILDTKINNEYQYLPSSIFQTLIVSSDEQVRNEPTGKHGCDSSRINGYVCISKRKQNFYCLNWRQLTFLATEEEM